MGRISFAPNEAPNAGKPRFGASRGPLEASILLEDRRAVAVFIVGAVVRAVANAAAVAVAVAGVDAVG